MCPFYPSKVNFEHRNAIIHGKTAEGRLTVWLLQLNSEDRITEREGLIELGRYPCTID